MVFECLIECDLRFFRFFYKLAINFVRFNFQRWNNDELEQFLYEAGDLEKYSYEDESDVSAGSFATESATDINEMKRYEEGSVNPGANTGEYIAFLREETIQSTYSKQQQQVRKVFLWS